MKTYDIYIYCNVVQPYKERKFWNMLKRGWTSCSHTIWFHFYKIARVVKLIETESRLVLPGAGQREVGNYCLINTEFQFWKMKRVMEMDGGNDFSASWMCLMAQNCTLKIIKHKCYVICILPQKITKIQSILPGSIVFYFDYYQLTFLLYSFPAAPMAVVLSVCAFSFPLWSYCNSYFSVIKAAEGGIFSLQIITTSPLPNSNRALPSRVPLCFALW